MSVPMVQPDDAQLAGLEVAEQESRGKLVWRIVRHRPQATIGALIILAFVLIAIFAPWIAPYHQHEQVGPVFGHPSTEHWLGLDDGGVDMLSLLIWGSRVSLIVG